MRLAAFVSWVYGVHLDAACVKLGGGVGVGYSKRRFSIRAHIFLDVDTQPPFQKEALIFCEQAFCKHCCVLNEAYGAQSMLWRYSGTR